MLVLTRKPRQQIMIGDEITINVVEIQGDSVRLAIDAPRTVRIYRGEIYKAIQEENQSAAATSTLNIDELQNLPSRNSRNTLQASASLQSNNQVSIQTAVQIPKH